LARQGLLTRFPHRPNHAAGTEHAPN